MIKRDITSQLLDAATEFPVLGIMGPRQSGKTTLARLAFPQHNYVNLENLATRRLALDDPMRFLKDFSNEHGIVIDEAQHVPELFSYIQVLADEVKPLGRYILTGSQNFVLYERITQSLAGRIAMFTLYPLSIHELVNAAILPLNIEELVLQGAYPRAYATKIDRERIFKNYIDTYVQKDVRQIRNITNLLSFEKFIRLCAARTGQMLNVHEIANSLDISHTTVNEWLSLLVSSYLVVLLQPYKKNYGKRLVKSPKLYFVDTGLACSLLGIRTKEDLIVSSMRGSLIETAIVIDMYKQYANLEMSPALYYWRDYAQHEVDIIIDKVSAPRAIEIKASKTPSPHYFSELTYWNKVANTQPSTNFVIYGGMDKQIWQDGTLLSWSLMGDLVKSIYS